MRRLANLLYGLLIGMGTTAFLAAALFGATYAEHPMPDHDRLGLVMAGAFFAVGGLLYFIGHGLRELLPADDTSVDLPARVTSKR